MNLTHIDSETIRIKLESDKPKVCIFDIPTDKFEESARKTKSKILTVGAKYYFRYFDYGSVRFFEVGLYHKKD